MGKKGAGDDAKQARQDEQARQQRIREGTKRIGDIFGKQFNDQFFTDTQGKYMAYATPQLAEQHGDAQKELTYALARSGTLESSSRADLASKLQQQYEIQRQKVADEALGYKTKAMTGVEDARSNLIAMLNATGDAQGAANAAMTRAKALSQPPAYSPLANLFADFTGALGARAAAERSYAMAGAAGAPGVRSFSPGGSVRVRR